jgi:ABC-type transport system involved in multi-copper enzyme maturation permease subunit
MQRIFAIIALTWKAAFRYRLFWVITTLLLAAVVCLPLLVKDDGTAAGFAQILITYTLSAVTGLLGLCTMWLSCGTLARDVEDCQIQMVAVKPIARWQIWLGKWLGLVTLNAALLAVAGASIYAMLEFRSRNLPPMQLFKLKNEVLVSRGSVREADLTPIIEKETERRMKEGTEKGKFNGLNLQVVQQQISEQLKADLQSVPPGGARIWRIHLGKAAAQELKGQPLFIRTKFASADLAQSSSTFAGEWYAGVPKKTEPWHDVEPSMAAGTFHEFPIPPNLYDEDGNLVIGFRNINETTLLFTFEDGLEVLFRQDGFGVNFIRGMGVILCWMSLLAAMGLAMASFMSFPVAAFVCMALLAITFSSGTLQTVVSDQTIMGWDSEKSTKGHTVADNVLVPVFAGMLWVINITQQFSPIDALSTGRSISWLELSKAIGLVVVLLGGVFGLFGIFVFNRRELATAQGTN